MNLTIMNIRINKIAKCLLVAVLMGLSLTAAAQKSNVLKGRVVNADGEPVVGAVVNVAEDNRIVLTDENGFFTLKGFRADDDVCAAALGYENAVVKVDPNASEFVITLEYSLQPMEKMMPIAFSSKKEKYMTESRSVVKGTELQRYPVTVLQNTFSSTLPGVETYEWSSEPGWTETQMYIRGIRTMNSSARNPLIIVDNVERDLSFLDAFPIENITVLKDAAATAIYGMRGANGAILVTTKRGEQGKTKIDFTQEVGFQMLTDKMENQNSYNMALTQNRVKYLNGQDPLWSEEQIAEYKFVSEGGQYADDDIRRYKYFNTNWFDQLYRNSAPVIKSNIQISGGNDRARYYVSFSYLRQEGMWNKTATSWNKHFSTDHTLNRWNLRTNIDINVNKYLNVGLDLGGRIDNIQQSLTSVFDLTTFGAVEATPMAPVFCPNGEVYSTGAYSGSARNPIQQMASGGLNKNRRRNLYSTLTINGDLGAITPGLKTNLLISFDAFDVFMSYQTNTYESYTYDYNNADVQRVEDFTYTRTNSYVELSNPTARERANSYNINFNYGFSYDRNFGKHHVDARAFLRAYRNRVNTLDSENHQPAMLSSRRNLSWNGYANYVYDDRYILNASISYMGNDNYAPEDRWDTFYGVGLGWILSNEKCLKTDWLDFWKIRASYGKTGQSETTGADTGRYPYQSTFGSGTGYAFGTNATWVDGMAETLAGNTNNKWEISRMVNAGMDWRLWGGKLYGSFDYFKEWRSNILINRNTIPAGIGISVAQDSYGKVESWGIEAVLGHENKIGDFKYNIEASVAWNTNRITEMDELEPNEEWLRKTGKRIFEQTSVQALYENVFNGTVGGWNQYQFVQWASDPALIATSHEDAIAHPEKYPYNTASAGNQPLGTAVFKDLNGDRKIDSNDMMPIGYTIIPEITPSISLSAEFKGFDLKVVGTAYLNRNVFISPAASFSGWSNMSTHEGVNFWGYYTDDPDDPRNVNAKYPRPVWGGYNAIDSDRGTGTYQNDIWIVNGNYFALRNIEFGYSLPKKLIAKARMTKCRIYVSGYNLKNWSKLPDGMDPEKPMSYCWWYPKTRIFNVGVNIGF
jgi:TonB-linked SusC/RagA family outer membrane protein